MDALNMSFRQLLWEFCGMTKILQRLLKLKPMQEKHNQGSYDGLRCHHEWPDVLQYFYGDLTITLKFEDFLNRVSIWGQFRDGVRPALGSLDPDPLYHGPPASYRLTPSLHCVVGLLVGF